MAAKTDDEILRYIESHKIMQLFENLTSCLFYDKPENPKEYLITRLKSLIAARDKIPGEEFDEMKLPTVGLFTNENIVGMFEMLDCQHRGYINFEKYHHGMISLGAKEFNLYPVGYDTDEITLDTFTTEADLALSNLYAAYQTPRSESLISVFPDKLLDLDTEFQEIEEYEMENGTDDEKETEEC